MSPGTVIAWLLVVPWALWAIVRVFGLDRTWLLIGVLSFTPWAVVGAIVAAGLAAALKRRAAAIAALACAVVLAVVVAPRALDDGEPAADGARPLRVLTLNLLGTATRADALVRLVRRTRADVLAVQELTPEGVETLEDAGLRRILPRAVLRPRRAARGTGLYARLPVRRAAPPRGTTFEMTAARVRVRGGGPVQLLSVHPKAPAGGDAMDDWRGDLRALPRASPRGRLRVLAGDFNATLDHRDLRRLIGTGYRDAAASAGAGLSATWPVGRSVLPMVTIDHVLADERIAVGDVRIEEVAGSDHRAVFAVLRVPRR
jgi:endonuclease/exonuclease/phosphatase (EEP) superfamily protein YafD